MHAVRGGHVNCAAPPRAGGPPAAAQRLPGGAPGNDRPGNDTAALFMGHYKLLLKIEWFAHE
jgi:hypothetical protein